MSLEPPRLRMIAGPNGSGKSRIREILKDVLVGIFVNADEIQLALNSEDGLNFSKYELKVTSDSLRQFVTEHPLFAATGLTANAKELRVSDNQLTGLHNSAGYLSTLIADFIRKQLIANRMSFTFETVMSSPTKLKL